MRDAKEVAAAYARLCDQPSEETAELALSTLAEFLEADRRAAKLECLRELRDRCNQAGSTHYWPEVIDGMIASLETEAAEPAKEET